MNSDRYVSPLGDRRERAISCDYCHADTWALDRICDECWARADDPSDLGAA